MWVLAAANALALVFCVFCCACCCADCCTKPADLNELHRVENKRRASQEKQNERGKKTTKTEEVDDQQETARDGAEKEQYIDTGRVLLDLPDVEKKPVQAKDNLEVEMVNRETVKGNVFGDQESAIDSNVFFKARRATKEDVF